MKSVRTSFARVFLACIVSYFAAAPITCVHAQTRAEVDVRHHAAVKRMLSALGIAETMLQAMRDVIARESKNQRSYGELLEELMKDATSDAMQDRLTPLFARNISYTHAEAASRFFESAAGQRIAAHEFAPPGTLRSPLSPEDAQAMAGFMRTDAGRALDKSLKSAMPEMGPLLQAWAKEIALARIQRDPESLAKLGRQATNEYVEQIRAKAIEHRQRLDAERRQYIADMAQYRIDTILTPEHIVAADKIRESQRALDAIEKDMERYLERIYAIQQQLAEDVKRIQAPKEARDNLLLGLERGMTRSYDLLIRYTENQRKSIELMRRMLGLAERALGRIRIEGGRLLFDSEDELDTYRALVVQLRASAAEEEKIEKEGETMRQRGVELLQLDRPEASAGSPGEDAATRGGR